MTDYRQLIENSIEKCQSSAADLRVAAKKTENTAAKNSFAQVAKDLEACVQKCRMALKQLS